MCNYKSREWLGLEGTLKVILFQLPTPLSEGDCAVEILRQIALYSKTQQMWQQVYKNSTITSVSFLPIPPTEQVMKKVLERREVSRSSPTTLNYLK